MSDSDRSTQTDDGGSDGGTSRTNDLAMVAKLATDLTEAFHDEFMGLWNKASDRLEGNLAKLSEKARQLLELNLEDRLLTAELEIRTSQQSEVQKGVSDQDKAIASLQQQIAEQRDIKTDADRRLKDCHNEIRDLLNSPSLLAVATVLAPAASALPAAAASALPAAAASALPAAAASARLGTVPQPSAPDQRQRKTRTRGQTSSGTRSSAEAEAGGSRRRVTRSSAAGPGGSGTSATRSSSGGEPPES